MQTNRDYQGPLSIDNEVAFVKNSLEAEDQGFEAYLRWQPSDRWLLTGQYTDISSEATHFRVINPLRASNRDNSVSPRFGSLMVDHDLGWWGLKLAGTWYYQDEVDWKAGPAASSYQGLDINLRKHFQYRGLSGRVELLAQNVTDEDFVDYHYFHDFDPRYYLRLVTDIR